MLCRIVVIAFLLQPVFAVSAPDTIKIAFIDPLSGPFANVGEVSHRHAQLAADGSMLAAACWVGTSAVRSFDRMHGAPAWRVADYPNGQKGQC